MTIAILTAGGIGSRTHQDLPKQFITVDNKPIIVYTLEAFQQHPNIDEIYVACLEGWNNVLDAYAKQFNIGIITDNIVKQKINGSAVAVIPTSEVVFVSKDGFKSKEALKREDLWRTQTPHSYKFDELWSIHQRAINDGITNTAASCSLMQHYGYTTYFSKGSEKNIKITTVEDIEIFKALLNAKNDAWIKK